LIRQTFAIFALRAGISTFDISRYMGASLIQITLRAVDAERADIDVSGVSHARGCYRHCLGGQRPRRGSSRTGG
jgi:hypothetical protein